jgi:hypothetical protein
MLRKISRATAAGIAALTLALIGARVQAEGVKLPASAIGAETFAIITMSIPKMDPASVEAAAKAVMGSSFASVQDGLTKYSEKYKEMSDSGAETVSIVVTGKPDDKEPNASVYVKMKPGADHAAAEKKIREAQAKEPGGDDMDITNEGDFLVMRKKGAEVIKGSEGERASTFSQVANTDKALSVVFVPTEAIRAKMNQPVGEATPEWGKAAVPLLAASKWMSLDVSLGETPNLGVTLQAADEAGAKGIADAVAQGSQQLKAQAAQLQQAGPQAAPMAQAFSGLADSLKATQSGSKISMSIDGKVIAPAVANLLPFMMNAGGAGGPPRKPGGGL